ncbi:hypothetical protein ACFYYM_29810 [Streptomyces erythrochromogenes]|uniref:hypothetical protein n=1 Tax=Streptomyces erythrochromogenes TaxID=285574 RepID=UPI003685CB80
MAVNQDSIAAPRPPPGRAFGKASVPNPRRGRTRIAGSARSSGYLFQGTPRWLF